LLAQVVQILVGERTQVHPWGERHRGSHHPAGELHDETDGYDAAPGYLDDLSRHKALAFDFDGESTPRTHVGPYS